MAEKKCSGDAEKEAMVEQDLWEALVRSEGISANWQSEAELTEDAFTVADRPQAQIFYPWNPATPEAEAFFADTASSISIFDGWQEDDIAHRSRSFFGQIDQLWFATLESNLAERFAARVPQQWLVAIAQHAQKVVADAQKAASDTSTLLADQLVQCVRDIAPSLADDDFYVLARPLAVQMRNGGMMTTVDSFVAQVPQIEWEQLSDIQRVRLGLAIARYAIGELHPPTEI